jgi:beta-mannosidase
VAKGIDTVSRVYINDKLIGTTDNMFVRYKFDVKQVLKTGQNKIAVSFESAVLYGKRQSESYEKSFGYPILPGIKLIYIEMDLYLNQNYTLRIECPDVVQHGECHNNYVRKMQSSFSWDWVRILTI